MNTLQQPALYKSGKKIKPIIKWTGGKYNEYAMFSQYIPSYKRYFEPFFGGGGVFFAMQPQVLSYLNDKSKDLIKFYSFIHEPSFKHELNIYADAWDDAGKLSQQLKVDLLPLYKSYISDVINADELKKTVHNIIKEYASESCLLFQHNFITDVKSFTQALNASVTDKCKRIKSICKKEGRAFTDAELEDHIETGMKSGLYLFLRGLTNQQFAEHILMSDAKAAANWYFVREFCYASMFRYNSKGGFNIPYGGIAYNKKNFRSKVENIFSPETQQLFSNAYFYNLDFENFLAKTKPDSNDFIFLDPPYDSEFSEYDQNAFTKDDQVRLRNVLINSPAKWMLVIKETDFIRSLYTLKQCRFVEFDKTYTYNVRGRNNRDTRHLIIVNYDT